MYLSSKQIEDRLDELIWQMEAEGRIPGPRGESDWWAARRVHICEGKLAGLRLAKDSLRHCRSRDVFADSSN